MSLDSIKRENNARIFDVLAGGETLSRLELSNKTGISLMTVGKVIGLLERNSALIQCKRQSDTAGRKSSLCRLDARRGFMVFDLSAEPYRICLYDILLNLRRQYTFGFDSLGEASMKAFMFFAEDGGSILSRGCLLPDGASDNIRREFLRRNGFDADLYETRTNMSALANSGACGGDVRRSDVCNGDVRRSDVCRSEVCRSEVCRSEVCRSEVCRSEVCRSEVCRSEVCRSEVCRSEVCVHLFCENASVTGGAIVADGALYSGGGHAGSFGELFRICGSIERTVDAVIAVLDPDRVRIQSADTDFRKKLIEKYPDKLIFQSDEDSRDASYGMALTLRRRWLDSIN